MKIKDHADHTEELYGLRAEDIHKWIDGYFDRESFEDFLRSGKTENYDPYDHRRFRHCRESLPDVIREFSHTYSEQDITRIFECHLRDDYNNYIPSREDFTNGTFSEKYHEFRDAKEPILTPGELSRYFKGLYYGRNRQKQPGDGGFRTRIVLPAALSLLLFLSVVFLLILPMFHDSLMKEKKLMIREISSVAVSILDYYISLENMGVLSLAEAQAGAMDEIRKLRYGADHSNYFWITDETPVMIVHPWRPDLEGQELSDYRDSMNKSGKKLFVESVRLVQEQGGGFLEYLWQPEENSRKTVSKLSYVQGVPRWHWIIGTGIYVHDVEVEISRLSRRLVLFFAAITGMMILVVLYMVYQSRIIEQNRRQAEAGLVEAKERYRALVEASNEGYILLLNHRKVFTNPTFQRMTGYAEEELDSETFLDLLFSKAIGNPKMKTHFENLQRDNPDNDEFEAPLQCRSGSILDVIVRVSRIFLTEENGQVLSFRPIMREPFAVPLFMEPRSLTDPVLFLEDLSNSTSAGHIVRTLNQLPLIVRTLILNRAGSEHIRQFISDIYTHAVRRIIELSLSETAEPPVPFAFLSLGSSGRREMTLFSDQDNALVFDSPASGEILESQRLYFLKLADRVCSRLNQAGFSYCPGGIMAVNPAHCLSVNEWKERYRGWFEQSDSLALLDLHVFFDIETAWGEETLTRNLRTRIHSLGDDNGEFFAHFARNCLNYKSSLGVLGQVRTEEKDGADVVNLKECLIPLVNFARLYALKHHMDETSTLGRLMKLGELGILNRSSLDELISAFETLWELRFSNQILSHGELRKVNDDMSLRGLSYENRKDFQKALSIINAAQSRLSFDFLGIDLS